MKLTVLLCTYNRDQLLRNVLRSLVHDTIEKPDSIIVVNGGDERADHVVSEFQEALEVKLVKTVNVNLATSRNLGLRHCLQTKAEIIAMTDDDAEVFPDWVTQMKRVHSAEKMAGAVGGQVIGKNVETLAGKVADALTFPYWTTAQPVRTLPGVNISYKREALEKTGFQDESLFRGEDVDYNWRIIKQGYKIYYHPDIKVYHYHRAEWKQVIHQQYMYGRAYYLVRRKWPDMYCVYPHRLGTLKDWLKSGYFVAAPFYDAFAALKRWPFKERISAYPLALTSNLAWKFGMVREKIAGRNG